MYYVYILQSTVSEHLYIGSTAEPDERFTAHNAGRGGWTKHYRSWIRILIEEYPDRLTAQKRERYLKSGWGRKWIQSHILNRAGLVT